MPLQQELVEDCGHAPNHPHEPKPRIEIHVNERRVDVVGHRQTGLEIKRAAIAQGVKIELDFLLYLVRHHHPNLPIGDDQEILVEHKSHFHAIADDDNS